MNSCLTIIFKLNTTTKGNKNIIKISIYHIGLSYYLLRVESIKFLFVIKN